jgi:hypothetical protein
MSTENPKNNKMDNKDQIWILRFFFWFAKNKKMQILLLLLIFVFPILVLINNVFIPVANFDLIPGQSENTLGIEDSTKNESKKPTKEQLALLNEIFEKEKNLAFQQNRLLLSRQDSIYLLVNIPDSSVTIEIKGLAARTCKIQSFEMSKRLHYGQHEALLNWLSEPFSLENELSTIPKTPTLVVEAPKDTAEAAKLPRKPLEPEKTFVQYTLWFSRNLVIEVEQTELPAESDFELIRRYKHQHDSLFKRSLIKKIAEPMHPDQPIQIKIKLNEADARAIYRAMPHSNYAKFILKL